MNRRTAPGASAARRPAVERSASDFVPRYYKVYAVIQRRIREGEWPPGTPMPTEEAFAGSFRVSRVTVRKALAMLQDERLIAREQGRGTFALPAPPRPVRESFAGFLENVRDFERDTRVRVLAYARGALSAEAAAALEQSAGAPGLDVARRLKVDVGTPLMAMNRVVRDPRGRPVEFLTALYRPDRYEYRVNLSRDRESAGPRWIARI